MIGPARRNPSSVSVWHELHTPRRPLRAEHIERVQQGARHGQLAASLYEGHSEPGVLALAIKKLSTVGLTGPENVVGLAAGIRAARLDQDVERIRSDAYKIFDPTEIEQFLRAQEIGTHAAELNVDRDIAPIVGDAVAVADGGYGGSCLKDATDFLGYTTALYGFQLEEQGVRA